MTIGVNTNNPGNLTTFGPNSFIYPGQTGNYSANGLTYAVFPDPQTGGNALTDYLNRNVGSYSSLSSFGNAYSGGSTNWINNVSSALGVDPSTNPSTINTNSLASAIQQAEGNMGLGNIFGGSPSSGSSLSSGFDPNNNTIANITNPNQLTLSGGSSSSGNNTQDTGLTGLNNLTQALDKFLSFFTIANWERGSFIFLGIALALIAVAVLIIENKTVQQTAQRVAKAAAIVA